VQGVDLHQLRYFLAVAEELDFGRAAGVYGITQQTLSAELARLESDVGIRLVDVDGGQITLTPAGRTFRDYAGRALALIGEGVDQARRSGRRAATLRVACVLDVQVALERRLNAFMEAYPDIGLTITLGVEPEVVSDLKGERADLALLWNPGPDTRDLPQRALTRERMIAALPGGHPLTGSALVRPEDVANDPLVLFDRWQAPAVYDALVRQVLHSSTAPRVVAAPDSSFRSRTDAVAAGLGVSVVAAVAADRLRRPEVAMRSMEPPIYLQTTAVWRQPPSAPAAALITFLIGPTR
jgi:DNA-binding transcriptional LysR family regulator